MSNSDYRGHHEAPSPDDGYAASLDRLTPMYPADVYDRPDLYHGGEDPIIRQGILAARGNPEFPVTVYRAMPESAGGAFNDGDWVTLTEEYARQHAIQDDDPANDWPVYSIQVRARNLFSEGNSLFEWGYSGPDVTGERV